MEINYSQELLRRDVEIRTHIIRELLAVKRQYCIEGMSVLELGCGLGQNLGVFRENNSVIGIEGLEDVVRVARLEGLDVNWGDLQREILLPSESVDWILCLDVLEHLSDPYFLMRETHRLLKKNGFVVLNVPNHLDWKGRIKILFGSGLDVHKFFPESNDWNNPHLRFFTHRGIIELVKMSGFNLVEDRTKNFGSGSLFSVLNWWGLGQLSKSIIKTWPALLGAGFFLVVSKNTAN